MHKLHNMGRRKGSVNKVKKLPRGVSFFSDGRARPYSVFHRGLPREFFATAEEAVARKRELLKLEKEQGTAALEYDRKTHAEVVEAKGILPEGVSLVDCARLWIKHNPGGFSYSVSEAVDVFFEKKRRANNLEPDTPLKTHRNLEDLHYRLEAFKLSFGNQMMTDISQDAVVEWLFSLNLSPRSVANYRAALNNFFNFSVRKRWIGFSPLEQISREDLPRVAAPEKNPLSIEQANQLLSLIKTMAPKYLPHFALRLFLGFRTAEARRFRWEWIQPQLARVYIPKGATKTGDAWSIPDVPPRFWEMVKKPNDKGKVPAPHDKLWYGQKAIKGKQSAREGLKALVLRELNLKKWPSNATRDTFCTLHISAYRDQQRTALILKHTNSQTLWRSYLGTLVPKEEAVKFFED